MNALTVATILSAVLAIAMAGGVGYGGLGYGGLGYGGLGYGGYGGYGGNGGGLGIGGGLGLGGVGVGSSVALIRGAPGLYKAVPGPAFLVRTIHQVNRLSSGGALVAHSGLGAGAYGSYVRGYGGGLDGYGSVLGYGGYGGYGGYSGYGGYGYKG
nr:chorion class B protein L11-like [Rhipicephalus microplus]